MSYNVVELTAALICIFRPMPPSSACRASDANYGTIMAVWEGIIQLESLV